MTGEIIEYYPYQDAFRLKLDRPGFCPWIDLNEVSKELGYDPNNPEAMIGRRIQIESYNEYVVIATNAIKLEPK